MPVVRGRGSTGLLTAVQARAPKPPPSALKIRAKDYADPIATLPVAHPAPTQQQDFEQRRAHAFHYVDTMVNAGHMTAGQGHAALQRMGFIPGGSAYKKPSAVGNIIAHTVAAPVQAAEYAGKKVVAGFTPHNTVASTSGRWVTPEYARAHPHKLFLHDPVSGRIKDPTVGAGFISPGTGLVAQTLTGLAKDATYNPGGLEQAIVHPGRTAQALGRNLKAVATDPLSHPDQALLAGWALLSGGGAGLSRLAGAGSALRAGEGFGAALRRPGHAGGSLLHTPEPGTHTLYVPGAAPESGIGPVPATQVDRLLSRNVVVRKAIQEPRNRRLQRALDRGAPAQVPKTKAGRFIRDQFSAQATVGREIRAQRRVENAFAQGPVTAQQRAVHGTSSLGNLTRGENTAVQVAAIEGHNALLNPDEVITRQIATHQRFIAEGKDKAANEAMIRDLKLARVALKNPSAKLKAALAQTRSLSLKTERDLIDAGHLTEETAAARKANIAGIYHGGRYEAPTPAKLGQPSQALIKAQSRVARLQSLFDRVTAETPISPGTRPTSIPRGGVATTQRAERIGGALSVAKDELQRIEKAAAGRVKPTGFIGGIPAAPEGSFFYPLSRRYTENIARPGSGTYAGTTNTAGGIAPPRGRSIVGSNPFTGKSIENAQRPVSVPDTIAERATRTNRLLDQERVYHRMWKVGTPVRQSEHQIPIRDTAQVRSETRKFFAQLHDHLHASPDEAAALNVNEARTLQDLLDAAEHKTAAVGAKIPGVRWVDQRYLKDMGANSVRGPIEKALDTITNPVRASSLYLRPAYALNLLGNAGQAAITQGHLAPKAIGGAIRAVRNDSLENTALVDSLVGASSSRAYSVNTGVMGKANQHLAEIWNTLTDLHARRSSFYHEAAKAGFDTPAARAALLHDPANRRKLVEVTRRANKNMIDFGSMTPLEQNTIRRVVYFYPFMSRAAVWALRTLVEHPGKAFTLAQLAQIGADNAHRKIGKVPGWAEQLGLIPVGGAKNGNVPVLNPSSINTLSTAAQLGQAAVGTARAAAGFPQGSAGFGDVVTPSVGLLAGLSTAGTGTGGTATGVQALLQSHPLYGIGRRAGLWGKPSKTYPDTGTAAALGPWAAGGMYPRNINQNALAAAAGKEARAGMSATERLFNTNAKTQKAFLDAAKQHWPEAVRGGKLPPPWQHALDLRAQRYAAYANAGISSTDPLYQRKAYISDINLLVKTGQATPQQAAAATRWAQSAPEDRLRAQRNRLGHTMFGGSVLTFARKQLKARGATLP